MPDHLRETTIASATIFEGKVVSLRVDEVILPDGGRSKREIVGHRGAVAAVALDGDDVLLVRQWRHPVEDVLLEIPAGTREVGEAPEQTMRRELEEEIGFRAGRLDRLTELFVAPGYSTELIHLYLATELTPAPRAADADENIVVVRLPWREAVRRCHAGELRDAKTVAALLLAAARFEY